ncbi:MAG: PEP-CTERM sorting domain-containing protein [Phycisphaeraceae bacterium]
MIGLSAVMGMHTASAQYTGPQTGPVGPQSGPSSWDNDDYIIYSFVPGVIHVADSDFSLKGVIAVDAGNFAFDSKGNLYVVNTSSEVRTIDIYAQAGGKIGSFTNEHMHVLRSIKTLPSDDIVGLTSTGIREFSPDGSAGKTYDTGTGIYRDLTLLPGGVLWATVQRASTYLIEVYDTNTGSMIGSVPLDNGQVGAGGSKYIAATNTVLMHDFGTDAAFERALDGSYIRTLNAPDYIDGGGFTALPNGDIIGTEAFDNGAIRWSSEGTYLESIDLLFTDGPDQIVHTGTIPEPASLAMLMVSGLLLTRRRVI